MVLPTLTTTAPDNSLEINRGTAFLLYATFCGDHERTAHALGVRCIDLIRVADDEGWDAKLGSIIALKKSQRPGDLERAINRALNYVQAHIWRQFLDRVVQQLAGLDAAEVSEHIFSDFEGKREGQGATPARKLSTRSLADLSSALEKAHEMTYKALNDTGGERTRRKLDEDDAQASPSQLFAEMAKAMASAEQSVTPRAMLFDAQLAKAEEVKGQVRIADGASKPTSPYDEDGH